MHEILNYLTWLNEIVKPYRELIDVVSASVIAVFTIVLARVGWKQTKITRILQRAYLDAKFGGIKNNRAGKAGRLRHFQKRRTPASAKTELVGNPQHRGQGLEATKNQPQRLGWEECYPRSARSGQWAAPAFPTQRRT
jgi:hypothetical protein